MRLQPPWVAASVNPLSTHGAGAARPGGDGRRGGPRVLAPPRAAEAGRRRAVGAAARRAQARAAARVGGDHQRGAPRDARGGAHPQPGARPAAPLAREPDAPQRGGGRTPPWLERRRVGRAAHAHHRPLLRRVLTHPGHAVRPPADDEPSGHEPRARAHECERPARLGASGAPHLAALPVHGRPAASRQERHLHARARDGAGEGGEWQEASSAR